jgi:hypothetical protein
MTDSKNPLYVVFDIEKAGTPTKFPIVAVGYVAGDQNGRIVSQGRQCIQVEWPRRDSEGKIADYGDFSPSCWEGFWCRLPQDTIKMFQEKAIPKEHAWNAVHQWFLDLQRKYDDIILVSDNPAFDIAEVQMCLEKPHELAGRSEFQALRTSIKDPLVYRDVYCADTIMMQFDRATRKWITDRVAAVVKHDHDPMNDAENIYRTYLAASELVRSRLGNIANTPVIA